MKVPDIRFVSQQGNHLTIRHNQIILEGDIKENASVPGKPIQGIIRVTSHAAFFSPYEENSKGANFLSKTTAVAAYIQGGDIWYDGGLTTLVHIMNAPDGFKEGSLGKKLLDTILSVATTMNPGGNLVFFENDCYQDVLTALKFQDHNLSQKISPQPRGYCVNITSLKLNPDPTLIPHKALIPVSAPAGAPAVSTGAGVVPDVVAPAAVSAPETTSTLAVAAVSEPAKPSVGVGETAEGAAPVVSPGAVPAPETVPTSAEAAAPAPVAGPPAKEPREQRSNTGVWSGKPFSSIASSRPGLRNRLKS